MQMGVLPQHLIFLYLAISCRLKNCSSPIMSFDRVAFRLVQDERSGCLSTS